MKKAFKITFWIMGSLVTFAILVIIAISAHIFITGWSPKQNINKAVGIKIGLNTISSVDEIKRTLIPLSYDLIIKKYPIFSNQRINNWYVLDPTSYNDAVSKILAEIQKAKGNSNPTPIDVYLQDAITFCPQTIYLQYFGNQRSVTDYLIHSIHESFHGLSCNSSSKLPLVWEEGITDYLAISTLENYVGTSVDTYRAFPDEVDIIKDILVLIPEKDLIDIYINKDESRLMASINKKFGNGTYEKIMPDMNIIFTKASYSDGFTSNPEVDEAFSRVKKELGSN